MDSTWIIIVTYNARPWINKCLNSIDFEKYKVVIIDNFSTDDTVAIVNNGFPEVILFQQTKNLGFGQANNIGISYALKHGAEHVFLLNQDAYLVEDMLDKLINFQSSHSEYGVLSPIHINADKTKLDRNFSLYMNFDNNPYFYSDHVIGTKSRMVYDVPFVNAAGWLISKKCLLTIGGFDPIFFHYGEDDNYCQRLLYHGFKIGVLSDTFLIHDREYRVKPSTKLFSKEYYKKELRKFKVKHANINEFDEVNFQVYLGRLRLQLIKALLKIDIQKFKNLKAYLTILKKTIPTINNSIKTNKMVQASYLDV